MKLYFLFLIMAATTVACPGPGVVMTLTNSLRYGMRGTLGGIIGIALGNLVVATVSATSLGALLATSPKAFVVIKYIGAAYLLYLGVRLLMTPSFKLEEMAAHKAGFTNGLLRAFLWLLRIRAQFSFSFPSFHSSLTL